VPQGGAVEKENYLKLPLAEKYNWLLTDPCQIKDKETLLRFQSEKCFYEVFLKYEIITLDDEIIKTQTIRLDIPLASEILNHYKDPWKRNQSE